MPQTRYVLQKALALDLPAIVIINKVDRGDARADEVLDEIYQLFIDLDAGDHHIDFEIISAVAREGRAIKGVGMPGDRRRPVAAARHHPRGDSRARPATPTRRCRRMVTTLDASEYLGRLAIGRVVNGVHAPRRDRRPARGGVRRGPGAAASAGSRQLMAFQGVGRNEVEELSAGDLFVVAGFPEVEIGDTIAVGRRRRSRCPA